MKAFGHAGVGVLRSVLSVLVGLVVFALAGAGALTWRLSDGPLDVTGLARRIAPTLAPGWTVQRLSLALVRPLGGNALQIDAAGLDHAAGDATQSVRSAAVDLALAPLLQGQVAPGRLVADGVRLQIPMPAPGGDAAPAARWRQTLDRLQSVAITDAEATISDPSGPGLTLRIATASLTRGSDGIVHAQAAAQAVSGGVTMQATAQGSYGPDGGQAEVNVPAVNPAALARAIPMLAAAGALDADLALRASVTLGPGWAVTHAALHAEAGAGTVNLPARGGTSPGHFASATLDAEGTPTHLDLRALRLVLAPPSGNPATTILVTGDADRAGGRATAHVAVGLDRLAFADLGALWPERVGGNARDWLRENVSAGVAHDGHAAFTLTGTDTGDDLALTHSAGALAGDDVTLWWLRPVPPVQHAAAAVTWPTPDTALITITGGRDGAVDTRSGTVRIAGLTGKDQVAFIDADLGGPLADVLGLLKHPRLNLLSKHKLPLTAPAGGVAAHLSVRLPLEAKVSIDQVAIHASGRISDAHLGGIAAGRDLDRGQLAFDVTNDGLGIEGPAAIAHVPAQLRVQMDFKAGPKSQVVQHVTAGLRVTKPDAARAGLGMLGLEGGALGAVVDYAERRDGTATIQLDADLKEAGLATPLGWSKVAGTPGHAEARAVLDHGRLVGLEGLRAEAPGLSVVARSELVNGAPSVVHLERGEIGRSSATGTIVLPQHAGEPYRVTLAGPRLDLEGRLDSSDPPGKSIDAKPAEASAPSYAIDLRFERVMLGRDHGLGPVTLVVAGEGRHVAQAHVVTGGAERVRADLVAAPGGRRLSASAADLGMLLRDTGLATELTGGALQIDGAFADGVAGSPFTGKLDLRGFKVAGALSVGKLLQALTVYGIVDALRGPGLAFDRLETPFRLQGSVLELENARAFSSSLGITASGRLDYARKTVDMSGTIVPAYFFNALPGRIPLLGRIFSPEKGSGLFAVDYSVRGALADPSVRVNPLSALTPGITRRFFDLFK